MKPRNGLLLVLGLLAFFAGDAGTVVAVVVRGGSEDASNVLLGISLSVLAVSLTLMLVYGQDKDSRALINSLAQGVKVALTDEQVTALRPTEDELRAVTQAAVAASQPTVKAEDIEAAVRKVLVEQPQPRPWVRALFYEKSV